VQPGSGNGIYRKSDVRTSDFLIEAKTTASKQYTLKLNDLEKNEKYALLDNRDPLFLLEIAGKEYYVVPAGNLEQYLEEAGYDVGTTTEE